MILRSTIRPSQTHKTPCLHDPTSIQTHQSSQFHDPIYAKVHKNFASSLSNVSPRTLANATTTATRTLMYPPRKRRGGSIGDPRATHARTHKFAGFHDLTKGHALQDVNPIAPNTKDMGSAIEIATARCCSDLRTQRSRGDQAVIAQQHASIT